MGDVFSFCCFITIVKYNNNKWCFRTLKLIELSRKCEKLDEPEFYPLVKNKPSTFLRCCVFIKQTLQIVLNQ